jgi:hypothetical protein
MKSRTLLILLALLSFVGHAFAQEGTPLSLRLSRDFGAGFGSQIQGTFSFHVTGPDDLERVVYFIDDVEIGQDTAAPFVLQFRTENYGLGVHSLRAEGFTADGRQLASNTLNREFISGSNATRRALTIIIPILVLSLGGTAVAAWFANRNSSKTGLPAIYGVLGGTICPNCAKPYAFHWWSFKLVVARFDRCPHCGKWKVVKRYPQSVLEASAEAMLAAQKMETAVSPTLSPEEQLRKKLDDSRFNDT